MLGRGGRAKVSMLAATAIPAVMIKFSRPTGDQSLVTGDEGTLGSEVAALDEGRLSGRHGLAGLFDFCRVRALHSPSRSWREYHNPFSSTSHIKRVDV